MSSRRSAERVLASLTAWIQQHLRLEVNATKSGTGRPWERKFLGFRINPQEKIEAAPTSVERFKTKVRELWRSGQSQTSEKPRDDWRAYVRGGWGYFRLAEDRRNLFGLEGWIRRRIRACFWQRWDNWRRTAAEAACLGTEWTLAESGAQFPRRVADRGQSERADGIKQRGVAALWVLDAIGPCGHRVKGRCVQPPDAANRTAGGVGGCRGAIPGTRPDRSFRNSDPRTCEMSRLGARDSS